MATTSSAQVTEGPDFFLPSAAARRLGVSSAAVRLWIRQGKLPALLLSGGVRAIKRDDLDRFARERARR